MADELLGIALDDESTAELDELAATEELLGVTEELLVAMDELLGIALDDESTAELDEVAATEELLVAMDELLELGRYGQELLNTPPGGQSVITPDKQTLSVSKTQ